MAVKQNPIDICEGKHLNYVLLQHRHVILDLMKSKHSCHLQTKLKHV